MVRGAVAGVHGRGGRRREGLPRRGSGRRARRYRFGGAEGRSRAVQCTCSVRALFNSVNYATTIVGPALPHLHTSYLSVCSAVLGPTERWPLRLLRFGCLSPNLDLEYRSSPPTRNGPVALVDQISGLRLQRRCAPRFSETDPCMRRPRVSPCMSSARHTKCGIRDQLTAGPWPSSAHRLVPSSSSSLTSPASTGKLAEIGGKFLPLSAPRRADLLQNRLTFAEPSGLS